MFKLKPLKSFRKRPIKTLFWLGILFVIGDILLVFLTIPDILSLKKTNPLETSMMQQRVNEAWWHGKTLKINRHWVPYSAISRNLRHAVLMGEDSEFFSNNGFDYDEIKEAVKTDIKKNAVCPGSQYHYHAIG